MITNVSLCATPICYIEVVENYAMNLKDEVILHTLSFIVAPT